VIAIFVYDHNLIN